MRGLLTLALACVAAPQPALAQPRAPNVMSSFAIDHTLPAHAAPGFFQRSDIAFTVLSVTAVAVAGHNDQWLRGRARTADSRSYRDLARGVRLLGDIRWVAPTLLAGYGLARALHEPELASGFTEVGLSVIVVGVETIVVKGVVVRARPEDSPTDSRSFSPFSGDTSFPSGHAAVAFALAESINRTSGSAWAPFATYPAAALVAWSRVRDDKHWTSDVLAGAALGVWTARKVHRMWPAEHRLLSRIGLTVCMPGGAPGLGLTLR